MYLLFFLVPFIFVTVMSFMMAVTKRKPITAGINIGKLHTADFNKLTEGQLKDLRWKLSTSLVLAFTITLVIGVVFIGLGFGEVSAATGIAVAFCTPLQMAIGFVALRPLLKKASLLKVEVDNYNE